ncbi:Ig-like domain-containing protein [Gemmatimonas sp.]|uniref:beta strand repeat-containing protein n=2 Tax=Gemmatimonas sp. TaxID=1962908 RepID=UPI0025C30AC3|nr:Ig-like domain-containing protein [Gemmatimonas sp.]MCA2982719.1 Ig-like domain-containing protein [Gemmatimonas sp.]MCA2987089.1 Ig-like domain-containing protein [Gemmatimonas sp.]MCA2996536.1 Ig-like domain-containing protein [Gemmatimonas sp.]
MQRRASFSWSALAATAALLAACNGDDGPRPPSTLAATSATSLTGIVGDVVSDPLAVKVTDDRGAALGGIVVTFAVAEGGGSVTPAVDTTDNTGVASTRWRLGGTAGQQRVSATVTGVTTQINFIAAAAAGAPANVAVQAGNNQSATAGTAVSTPPSVIVRDRFNNPVNATSVFFSISGGGGSVTGAGATTNASGVATVGSWTLGPNVGTNTLTALVVANGVTANPITFTANGTAGTAAAISAQTSTSITGTVGGLVTPVPSIRVLDANGNPVAGVNVNFTASTGSTVVGGAKTTNLQGVASPDGWQLGSTAATYTLSATVGSLPPVVFSAVARAGAAATMSILAGNNQSATVGRTLPVDPSVRITDALGNPIAGQEVVFEVIDGGGSAVARRPVTDANGTATVGAWTLGETPGTNTLRATATGLTVQPVVFTALATAGAPASLTISAGNNQTATAGALLPVAPSVVVRDNRGNPVAGVTVTFTASTGVLTGASAVSNAAGQATVGSWRLGNTAGVQTLTASIINVPTVTFTATATAGVAANVVVVGDSVAPNFPVNSFISPLPTARVVDANGNPVSGAAVTFESLDGTNTLVGATRTTGTDGLAQLTSWRIGTTAGVYRLRVLVSGLTLTPDVTWRVTGTALAASQAAALSAATQNATAGTAVTSIPTVRVTDQFNNPVLGVTVTFAVGTGSGTISGGTTVTAVTDANGSASSGAWVMPSGSGARTVTATVSGSILGSPITFTANVP